MKVEYQQQKYPMRKEREREIDCRSLVEQRKLKSQDMCDTLLLLIMPLHYIVKLY